MGIWCSPTHFLGRVWVDMEQLIYSDAQKLSYTICFVVYCHHKCLIVVFVLNATDKSYLELELIQCEGFFFLFVWGIFLDLFYFYFELQSECLVPVGSLLVIPTIWTLLRRVWNCRIDFAFSKINDLHFIHLIWQIWDKR